MTESTVPSSLYPIIHDFLVKTGLRKTLKAFRKESKTQKGNGNRVDLLTAVNFFTQNHKISDIPEKESKKKRKKKETTIEESVDDPVLTKKQKKEQVLPVEESATEKQEEENTKKKKKKKKQKQNGTASNSHEENSHAQEKEKSETQKAEVEVEVEVEAEDQQDKVTTPIINSKKQKNESPSQPFRRIRAEDEEVDERLKSNDYSVKNGDWYGQKAYDDLKIVRGKDFRHAKTKKKRGTYRGGEIDLGVRSVKFE